MGGGRGCPGIGTEHNVHKNRGGIEVCINFKKLQVKVPIHFLGAQRRRCTPLECVIRGMDIRNSLKIAGFRSRSVHCEGIVCMEAHHLPHGQHYQAWEIKHYLLIGLWLLNF